jgi:hypothetical protein
MQRTIKLNYALVGEPESAAQKRFRDGLIAALNARGHHFDVEPEEHTHLVVTFGAHGVTDAKPILFTVPDHRRTKILTVVELEQRPADPLAEGYPELVRHLSPLVLLLVAKENGRAEIATSFLIGLEQSHPEMRYTSDGAFYGDLLSRLEPQVGAKWVIDNIVRDDLPVELWREAKGPDQIIAAGKRMDRLGLLPPPFPMKEFITEEQQRRVALITKITGLSYGNLSLRETHPLAPAGAFWMSASGVDKAQLKRENIMLVVERQGTAMIVRVAPGVKPGRVSVDAVEHHMIYTQTPVGAMLHTHVWPKKIHPEYSLHFTDVSLPCGSEELGLTTASKILSAPNPNRAVVAQRNHGVVITGDSLDQILDRVENGDLEFVEEVVQR